MQAKPSPPPLWREEFSIFKSDERYVNRRQLTKFLTLTSLAMFVGNSWILIRSRLWSKAPALPVTPVAAVGEIPIGGVKLFQYPRDGEQCILVRVEQDAYVAYSQKCTHLSCAVFYSHESRDLVCPCHEGHFSVRDGSVLQGPPTRPLPAVQLERRGDQLVAIGMTNTGAD
jgi:nitrite reductase/ring-hydroxylating ferredoxin subunit